MTDPTPAPYGAYRPRPTVYKGIEMRSRLEAGYAAWLDRWFFEWDYEPCAFSSPEGRQYLPDFRVRNVRVLGFHNGPVTAYVEVKPLAALQDPERRRQVLEDLTIIRRAEPGAVTLIEASDGQSSRTLMTNRHAGSAFTERMWWVRLGHYLPEVGLALKAEDQDQPWHGEWWRG